MKLAPRDQKSQKVTRPNAVARAGVQLGLRVLALMLLASTLFGCDIVQGFQDAGDSLFPEQSTHLASPGLRLVSGGYRELGVVAGTELYLLARHPDDATNKLFSMRYADPHPCEIPAVGRYSATREPTRRAPLLYYFNENVRIGTLRFADVNCKLYDQTFAEAQLPIAETESALVVWAGKDLWLATPELGKQELLTSGVEDVIAGVFGKRYAVRSDGRLNVFGPDWKSQGSFGSKVNAVVRGGKSLFYTDESGAHRIVANKSNDQLVEDESILGDACSLGTQDGTWVTFRSPCSGGPVIVFHEPSGERFTLGFDADPRNLRLNPALNSPGRNPLKDPFWFFYLRSGNTEESRNTLFVRTPAGVEHALGAHSTLLQLRFLESATKSYGYALVDVNGETGRYIWWNQEGETRTLAQNTMWRPRRLITDFDGMLGNLAVTSGDRLLVLTERVLWQAYEYQDGTKQWTVLFDDSDGQTGRLSAFAGGIDGLQATPPESPFEVPALESVASDVTAYRTGSLNEVLSGVIYFTDFDPQTGTGKLAYRNQELRFTARVNDDVSDYVVAHDEVLYTIPYGENAGIWLVAGK